MLAFLRSAIQKKGFNTAQLALRAGLDRSAIKRRLAGEEDLTVDDMIALSKALELTAAELGLANLDEPADPPVAERPAVAPAGPDPYGNLPRQVVEVGFALGVDLFFVLDPQKLVNSGVPRTVLDANREQLRLRMDARYFQQNKFQFLDEELTCMLSFDALYACTLPWSAFRAVTLLFPEEAATEQKPAPAARPPRGAGPTHLRIVK